MSGLDSAEFNPPYRGVCNVCCDEAQILLGQGERDVFPDMSSELDAIRHSAGVPVDYICANCGSRARWRLLRVLLTHSRGFLSTGAPLMMVSAGPLERDMVAKNFALPATHVSLVGDFGDPGCITGVDLRAMPAFASGKFGTVIASGVLDYIAEIDQVFREMKRILLPGGAFIFFIMQYRLVDDPDFTVRVINHDALHADAQVPKRADGTTGMPDCRFGVSWLIETVRAAGLNPVPYPSRDPISDLRLTWYVARAAFS